MAENLILPVPELISAVYLVPLPLSAQAAKDRATAGLSARVASPVAVAARMMLDGGALTVHAVSSSSLPPVPGPLQEYLGVARELVRTVAEASDFVAVRASGPPGWPPMHEWAGRACAAVLATQCGVPLVDTVIPEILAADAALRTLPGTEDARFRLADWMSVFHSAGIGGLGMTTKGLGRFGLPELQARNVPPQLGQAWTRVLTGLASSLLGSWLKRCATGPSPPLPSCPRCSRSARATSPGPTMHPSPRVPPCPFGSRSIPARRTAPTASCPCSRLMSTRPRPGSSWPGCARHCSASTSSRSGTWRPRMRCSGPCRTRAALPAVRARFLAGDLPPRAQLMIKHEISAPGRAEYPWAYVTSWTDPARVLGSAAGDATLDLGIRTGPPDRRRHRDDHRLGDLDRREGHHRRWPDQRDRPGPRPLMAGEAARCRAQPALVAVTRNRRSDSLLTVTGVKLTCL